MGFPRCRGRVSLRKPSSLTSRTWRLKRFGSRINLVPVAGSGEQRGNVRQPAVNNPATAANSAAMFPVLSLTSCRRPRKAVTVPEKCQSGAGPTLDGVEEVGINFDGGGLADKVQAQENGGHAMTFFD